MESIVSAVRQLGSTLDALGRKKLISALYGLAASLETPGDTMQRIDYGSVNLGVTAIGSRLGIFTFLAAHDEPQTSDQVAAATGIHPLTTRRLLRHLAALRLVDEVGDNGYAATATARAFAEPDMQGSFLWHIGVVTRIMEAAPDYLESHKSLPLDQQTDTAFHTGYNTTEMAWQWLAHEPKHAAAFMGAMRCQRLDQPLWLDRFPLASESRDWPQDRPLFVDIGGNAGHICKQVLAAAPQARGQIYLQDLPPVIKDAPPTDGVVPMAHDFKTEQPVKGAKYYYLRNILHDSPDELSKTILEQIKPAMARDSVILIDDVVLADRGADVEATQLDMLMMFGIAGRERTAAQWQTLVASAGCKIVDVCIYVPWIGEAVQRVVPVDFE